jgi:Cu-Zn family superoxide dismutase
MALALASVALATAACQSTKDAGPLATPKGAAPTPGVEAVLIPIGGSAAQGSAKFAARGNGVAALVVVNNVIPGPYRIVIHERGNCSSPNGFSAGRPWAPAGSARSAADLLPELNIGSNGNGQMATTIPGLRLTGPDSLEGRSVVVHMGSTLDADVIPDRPNRLVLCGVIGPLRSFMDLFN